MPLTYRRGEAIIQENGNAIDRSSSHRERVQSRAIASDDRRREYARRDLGQDSGKSRAASGASRGQPVTTEAVRHPAARRRQREARPQSGISLQVAYPPATHPWAATGNLREGAPVIERSTGSGVGGVAGAAIVFCYFQHRKLAE